MEVSDFLRIDEQIFGLDVSVNDIGSVAEGDTLYHLIDVESKALGLNKVNKGKQLVKAGTWLEK